MGRLDRTSSRSFSVLLTPLQVQVAEIIKRLPESEGFALAGAGALMVQGLIHRTTRDLDYFTTPGEAGAFVRIEVSGESDRCEIDLAVDYRALPAEPSEYGPTLAVRELAANKVLAVFDRAEARDFLDLAELTAQFELRALMELASEKDRGFDTAGSRTVCRLSTDSRRLTSVWKTPSMNVSERWSLCGETSSRASRDKSHPKLMKLLIPVVGRFGDTEPLSFKGRLRVACNM